MNWDAIGAVGDLVSGIGVIVTLGYLAVQIRQSTSAAKSDARQRILDRYSDAKRTIVSAGSSQAFGGLLEDPRQLPMPERIDANLLMTLFADNLLNAIRLRKEGILDTETFTYISDSFVNGVRTPGGGLWWEDVQVAMPKSLVDHVSEEAARLDSTDAPNPFVSTADPTENFFRVP